MPNRPDRPSTALSALSALFLLGLLALGSGRADAQQGGEGTVPLSFELEFTELRNRNGQLLVLIFGGDTGFPDQPERAIWQGMSPIGSGPVRLPVRLELSQLPSRIAVSAIHDENGNGEMDTNFLGIPREGFGFTAVQELPRLRRPTFADTAIPLPRDGDVVQVRIRYF